MGYLFQATRFGICGGHAMPWPMAVTLEGGVSAFVGICLEHKYLVCKGSASIVSDRKTRWTALRVASRS
jgi:hypothetical protein